MAAFLLARGHDKILNRLRLERLIESVAAFLPRAQRRSDSDRKFFIACASAFGART